MPLVPYIDVNLNITDFKSGNNVTTHINNIIEKILPFRITASRFRKTKSDILMRVTQDMYLVSQGLNNTIDVVQKSYSSGIKSDHDRNVSAAMEAQAAIAKGIKINEAVKDAKVLHSDILSGYDYSERLRRNEIPVHTITPSGIRCSGDDNFTSQVERKIKNFSINLEHDESKCTNFLSCFDCSNHVLVASEDDIWLMLSFYEQVLDIKEIPSQNSIPKTKLYEIESILSRTLLRFKNKAPIAYHAAEIKIESQGYHPLYSNLRGLTDTMETFNV